MATPPRAAPRFWRAPALPFAESRRSVGSRACYRPHTHATLSIGAVDEGASVFTSRGHSARIGPGSLVIVPAGCVHACNPASGMRWSYQMLHLDPDWVAGVMARADRRAAPLRHAWVVHHAPAYAAFCALNQRLFSEAASPDKAQAIERFITEGLWRDGQPLVLAPDTASPPLGRVLALLHRHHADPLPLSMLAQAAGMAPRTLARAFRAATGLTPHAYQLDLRINAARGLLGAGGAPADVAQALGFYDQSHFQHAFKQRVAATPGVYRRTAAP